MEMAASKNIKLEDLTVILLIDGVHQLLKEDRKKFLEVIKSAIDFNLSKTFLGISVIAGTSYVPIRNVFNGEEFLNLQIILFCFSFPTTRYIFNTSSSWACSIYGWKTSFRGVSEVHRRSNGRTWPITSVSLTGYF